MDTYAGDGGLHSIHDSVTGETTTYVRDSLGRLISSRGEGEKATQYSYDENNRLTRWVYTIPTLSRTAMHYTYNTTTTDTIPDGLLTGVTMFDKNTITYGYDFLQRLQNKTVANKLKETYAYSPGTGTNTTTNRVSTKFVYWNNSLIHQFQHGYDVLGNITSVYDAVTLKRVNYAYDDQGQLLQADHIENGTTVTRIERYTYDNVGNILTFNNGTTSHTYTYGDTQWRDLLTAVDGNEITYDASGNPTEYYNEWPMTWVEGRRLESVTTAEGKYTYEYNADGQRVKKTNPDGTYVEYYVMDGTTVGESHFTKTGSKTLGIRYTLDESNSVIGFTMSGVNYYFAKNLQGDILAVYNSSTNAVVAQYTYDSWGNILTATGTLAETNPFRYRSYYYDEETNFYYLQSRYYDAAICRFINADSYTSTGTGLLGYNMFSYCMNNPVNMFDAYGNWPKWISGALNIVSGFSQAALGAAIGAAAGWTGIGAVAAAALVVNGAATATQGIGQIVNSVTQSNTMREDNIVRTGVQSIGKTIAGDTGATVAGMIYDTGILAASLYTPRVQLPQSTLPQGVHTASTTSPRKVSNPYGSHTQLDNSGNIYSYAQYDSLGRQNLRIDFQGKPHAGVLPHIHLYVYPERGGRAEYIFDLDWNLIG